MPPPAEAWFHAFLLTCAIELPIVLVLTQDSALSSTRRAVLALFAQLATHPLVWYVFPALPVSPLAGFVLSEIFAWLAESAFYAATSAAKRPLGAVGVAAIANSVSLGVGFFVHF